MSNEISGAASEINRLHVEICQAARTTIDKAIRIGELLTEQKAALKHGEWLPWLKENVEFSRQTADNYRRIYEKREDIKLLNVSNLSDVYRLLTGGKNEPDTQTQDYDYDGVWEQIQFRLWKLERRLDAACLIPNEDATLDDIKELKAIIDEATELGNVASVYQLNCERALGKLLHATRPLASAIAEIRDKRLYRETYTSFAKYCEAEHGMTEAAVNKFLSTVLVPIGGAE